MGHKSKDTSLTTRYRSPSLRLPSWDYSQAGWYFFTICTRNRQCTLGEMVDGSVVLTPAGQIVKEEWQRTAIVRPHLGLDEFVVMPNHVHGIVVLLGDPRKMSQRDVSTKSRLRPDSLGAIIGQCKSICTKRIREAGFLNLPGRRGFMNILFGMSVR